MGVISAINEKSPIKSPKKIDLFQWPQSLGTEKAALRLDEDTVRRRRVLY